jgi:hypothetical protein
VTFFLAVLSEAKQIFNHFRNLVVPKCSILEVMFQNLNFFKKIATSKCNFRNVVFGGILVFSGPTIRIIEGILEAW